MSTHVGSPFSPCEGLMTEQTSHIKRTKYCPPNPESIKNLSVGILLNGRRNIIPNQQPRLGFESEGLALELWCAGDISLVQKTCVSIVGTRAVSTEGAARARRLGRDLAEAEIVVFSGLAKGVDTEALQSAINSNGRVVAVIGTPLDKAYPAENKHLQEEIYRNHLLISQFHPGQRVFPSHFPERNKLMAALSDATVIIEAGETSGTLHQAAECLRQGRWLFIAQAVIDDKSLSWPARFTSHEKCRVLKVTEDLLSVLR